MPIVYLYDRRSLIFGFDNIHPFSTAAHKLEALGSINVDIPATLIFPRPDDRGRKFVCFKSGQGHVE
jgi:hypothetical protein